MNYTTSITDSTFTSHRLTIGHNWANKVIMIADDVKVNFLLLQAIIKRTKARIIWADNGADAVEKVKKGEKVDLVIMDYNMPKLNGLIATKKIKQHNKDIPVISQTSHTEGSEEFENLRLECDDYLTKPITTNGLLGTLGRFLD